MVSTESMAYGPKTNGIQTPTFMPYETVFIGGGSGLQFVEPVSATPPALFVFWGSVQQPSSAAMLIPGAQPSVCPITDLFN